MADESTDWVAVAIAAREAGCTEQYICRVLAANTPDGESHTDGGPLKGWRVNGKAWVVDRASLEQFAKELSTRARKHQDAKKLAAKPKRKPRK